MNKRVFISHSSKDEQLVSQFLDLYWGEARPKNPSFFCTSSPGALTPGESFIQQIKKELETCSGVIFLITENYMKSPFCLAELGAAWALNQNILPILFPSVSTAEYNSTPLEGIQFININSEGAVFEIKERLNKWKTNIVREKDFYEYYIRVSNDPNSFFICSQTTKEEPATPYLLPSADGWYEAKVTCTRHSEKNNKQFTFLQLDGLLETGEKPQEDETHWVMYEKGNYEDAVVGDFIKFEKDEVRYLYEPELTRNIYIKSLEVIKRT